MRFHWRFLKPSIVRALRCHLVETVLERICPAQIMVIAAISLAAIFGIFAFTLYAARLDVAAAARTASGNLAVAVGRQLARDVEMLDLSLQDLVDGASRGDVLDLPPSLRRAVVFDRPAMGHDHGALLWVDAAGHLVAQSGADSVPAIDVSQEAFFKVHASRPDAGLFVSRPFVSPIDGEVSVALSRRITRYGAFAGIGAATIRLSTIQSFLRTLDLGPRGNATLVSSDGSILVSEPFVASAVGSEVLAFADGSEDDQRPPRSGWEGQPHVFAFTSPIDGVNRLVASSRVGLYGLTVFIGQSLDDIYAAWWRRAGMTGIAMLLLGHVILVLIAALQVALRRRQIAEAELERLARTDKLTGLANRRSFDETLDRAWTRARESRQPVALLLVDIDCFKAFNDHFGHQGGDGVLAAVAGCIARAVHGPSDLAARYGGEEFAVLLPDRDAYDALVVARRIERLVRDLAQPHPSSPARILTVSIGVAARRCAPHEIADDLVRLADLSLYEAKAEGRNRIVLHGARKAA